ncbi:c-type cytochrome biogenesis protein CcmI [Neptuniibacter halophilus]|uniref:c-type cytochrome biogenesis protein CcmI n=1 Tax=Neptuniibacter halophilus TaxID=651666 RepID=UPI0025748CC9|nr:c-type cytochrome biogenesis protein CcmI [Neptuniibacter halophilus]
MIELWIGIALLSMLAIAFVFLPFLRARRQIGLELSEDREQQNIEIFRERLAELELEKSTGNLEEEDFAALKTELERNLLVDVKRESTSGGKLALTSQVLITVTILAMLVPVAGIGLYSVLGRSADLELSLQQPADPFNGRQPTLEEAIAQLEKELELHPENPEGWYLLSTTYMNQGRFTQAAEGFRQVLDLLPEEAPQYPSVMGQYAQALFFAADSKMTPQVRTQIDKTLAIEPFEIAALGLLGIDAYEQENYELALEHWLKALRNAEGQTAETLRGGVRRARDALLAQGKEVPEIPELADVSVALNVSISEELKAGLNPDQIVFVFARAEGGGMPLAAVRLTVADLPAEVILDDSMAMVPQQRLSSASGVELSARISTSGQPQQQKGDLYGLIGPVTVAEINEPVTLVIDKVVE